MNSSPCPPVAGAGEPVDSALDEAYERMARTDFELPNGFVNHGPMACEALAVLGRHEQVDGWARWFADAVGEGPKPVEPNGTRLFDWSSALGDYQRLPEWLGYYGQFLADSGWESAIEVWVPRLMPGLASALFHGAIRTAHAARAVSVSDTEPRRAELARSLAYWSARFRPGQDVAQGGTVREVRDDVIEAAADGASRYVTRPSIFHLHGVTGAMAVEILVDHLPPAAGDDALRQLRADHEAIYRGIEVTVAANSGAWDDAWVDRATRSRDAHQVKLVESCRRGFEATGDPRFAAAAERVVG
ncbi:MAG: hypothetical protein ACRD0Z_12635 [Acidimicrobiales bacterium]